MIHVAEAGEAKGRVVLELSCSTLSPLAIEAAVWLARAFQSEIEGLYVENRQLLEMADYPFVREVSFSGRSRKVLSRDEIERHFRFASAEFHRTIERIAQAFEVPVKPRVMRDIPVDAIALACAEHGPWNVVVLSEPFPSPACPSVLQLFQNVTGTTGLLLVGPASRRARGISPGHKPVSTHGRVVVVLDRAEQLQAMLTAADRLAAINEFGVTMLLVAVDPEPLAELETMIRLALADRGDVLLAHLDLARTSTGAVAETLRRHLPELVIGRFGGLVFSCEDVLKQLAEELECPVLLVR